MPEDGILENGNIEARIIAWQIDERPDDLDNPCAYCKERMPFNPWTAIFGVHFECLNKEATEKGWTQ